MCGITHTRLRQGINSNGIPYTSKLPCGHRFYTSALLKWVDVRHDNPSCPMCRKSFNVRIEDS
jgi:hypothetical protein